MPLVWWCCWGESFLSLTERLPADALVVEGWIGLNGVRAAEAEFAQHGYKYIVATGDLHTDPWDNDHVSFATLTAQELMRLGVPANRIVIAPAVETDTQRTYESARAVRRVLRDAGFKPRYFNVFTLGPHARRSRLVFAKVVSPETKVGAVAWLPPGYDTTPWWSSSERSKAMLTETIGYLYERLFNSGRRTSLPAGEE
jgi:uncharacterized SAM-binding protein YcdF (DUF218 family)